MAGHLNLTPAGVLDSRAAIIGDATALRSLRQAIDEALAAGVSEVTIRDEEGLPVVLRVELAESTAP